MTLRRATAGGRPRARSSCSRDLQSSSSPQTCLARCRLAGRTTGFGRPKRGAPRPLVVLRAARRCVVEQRAEFTDRKRNRRFGIPFLGPLPALSCSDMCRVVACTQFLITERLAMSSTTFTVRVETDVKKRLEKLAKSTGRSRSFLAAEALNEYLDVNEWQVAGVRKAMGSLDRGEGVPNEQVKAWVNSWDSKPERPTPKPSAK
jgi:RHH-type rel operon transcriptional repressor/antitoxin RelB